jgi:hypothetical protein
MTRWIHFIHKFKNLTIALSIFYNQLEPGKQMDYLETKTMFKTKIQKIKIIV